jgi:hypothetical protein
MKEKESSLESLGQTPVNHGHQMINAQNGAANQMTSIQSGQGQKMPIILTNQGHHISQHLINQQLAKLLSQQGLKMAQSYHQNQGHQSSGPINLLPGNLQQAPPLNLAPPQLAQHHYQRSGHVARAVPRITGPRLQRPKAKSKDPKVDLAEADRRAVCPPGNEPLIDDASGRLRLCNGLEPHCPPRSYCYVTGVASADYNCCTVP